MKKSGVLTLEGEKKSGVNVLRDHRIILVYEEFLDGIAKEVTTNIVDLGFSDPTKSIRVFINSPGGDMYSMISVIDSMRLIKNPIETTCIGLAASAAGVLLACGDPGKRFATKNSRIMLHQVSHEGFGHIKDLEIDVDEAKRLNEWMLDVLSVQTHQPISRLKKDLDRDKWFTADEAKKYGIIDYVV